MTTTRTTDRNERALPLAGFRSPFFVAQMLDGSSRTWFIELAAGANALTVQHWAVVRGHDLEAFRDQNPEGFFSFTAGGFAMTTKPKKVRKDVSLNFRLTARDRDDFAAACEALGLHTNDVLRLFMRSYAASPASFRLGALTQSVEPVRQAA
ncbi:hypothetical protein [Burkholderia vietnamiensis]|uniref:hypothetical protein n=1 Tax=Burkholderia vietnamiensis TaxID=60552 RepID=UPI001593C925|nr:hypothetical protein [Burkholderia vietnamiensis]